MTPAGAPGDGPTLPVPSDPTGGPTVPVRIDPVPPLQSARTSGLWVGLALSVVVLMLLLIFILQNLAPVDIHFLGVYGRLPAGVALLVAAIGGVALVAIPASLRTLQLRRAAGRAGAEAVR